MSLDLNEQSQICAQSLFARSKPSQLRIWLRKWKRDSWTQHLSGRILRLSHTNHFTDAWTSSLGDTHANPSVQPANVKVSKTRGIFGRLLQMAFDFSNPSAASLRTLKDISAWGCPTSSKTWQEWVIERRGAYSARLNAARRTGESGCSSWPTPQVGEEKVCMTGSQNQRMLSHAVIDGPLVPASSNTDGSRLESWATPRTGAIDSTRPNNKGGVPLADQVARSWATPDVSDRRSDNCRQIGLSNQTQGKLNPRWVETLMGLPVGWTMPSCASPVTIERMNSDYSETVLSQQPPLSHSKL